MKAINIVNTLVLIENVLGIHRNYYLIKRSLVYLVKLRILFDTCIISFAYAYLYSNVADGFYQDSTPDTGYTVVKFYMFFASVNAIGAIILSCCKTEQFKEFVLNMEAVHELYKNNTLYRNVRKTQCKKFYIDLTLIFVILMIMFAYYVCDSIGVTVGIFRVILLFVEISLELRFCYENFVFCEFIKLIVAPLKFLNEAVSLTVAKLRGCCADAGYDDELWGVRGELGKWGEASQLLAVASDRLSDCFGTQIAISFLTATFYYIFLLYVVIGFAIKKNISANGTSMYGLMTYVWVKLVVVVAGQRVQSEAEQLNRNLLVLQNTLLAIPGSAAGSLARDAAALARRLRAAPLRVRLLSSLAVQMALVTGILATVANYTIVLLQFYHVV